MSNNRKSRFAALALSVLLSAAACAPETPTDSISSDVLPNASVSATASVSPLQQRVAAVAMAEVGVVENPLGSNKVPGKGYGNINNQWCANFVTWVLGSAGIRPSDSGRGSFNSNMARAWSTSGKKNGVGRLGTAHDARIGDLLIQYYDESSSGGGHISIVVGVNVNGRSNLVQTVGGNESDRVRLQTKNLDVDRHYLVTLAEMQASTLGDGAFVKSDVSAAVYAMVGGFPVPISSMNPVGSKPVAVVTASQLASLRTANPFPRDGAFVKSDVSAAVYAMVGGFPVPISSMNPVGSKPYAVVTESSLSLLRAANPFPRDGAFVKSDVSATVYGMVGGFPVPISTMNPVGSKPYAVVTESSLSLLRAANPFPRDGAFVKSDVSASVYAMVGGFPVPISTMNPVGSKAYAVVTESSLTLLRAANPFPRDGAFVKSDAKATVYAMVGGFPVPISTMNPVGSKPYAVVTESSLTLMRTANPRPRDGAFVKSDVSATVYKIVGGYPVPISSMNQVGSKPIAVVTESSLALLRTAKP